MNNLGLTITVSGEIAKYDFTNDAGERIRFVKVLFPGGEVRVDLREETLDVLEDGQVWQFVGQGAVSSSGKLRVSQLREAVQLGHRQVNGADELSLLQPLKDAPQPKPVGGAK